MKKTTVRKTTTSMRRKTYSKNTTDTNTSIHVIGKKYRVHHKKIVDHKVVIVYVVEKVYAKGCWSYC
jgi:hypothetical protein